jgi:hypothetical protein
LFLVLGNVGGCRDGDYWHGQHQKHIVSRWNFVCLTADIDTSGLATAILDFQLPVACDSVAVNLNELVNPENGG